MPRQIKSKERVRNHGEVFTNPREVNAMLDMVKDECNNFESTFLEPACGEGAFLVEIMKRKLKAIARKKKPNYTKNQEAYEKALLVAVGSIYGIDIMPDNTKVCVARLYKMAADEYEKKFSETYSRDLERGVLYILSRNIVCGNALTMLDLQEKPIRFSEWKNPENGYISRKEYSFADLVQNGENADTLLAIMEPYYISEKAKDFGLIDYHEVFRFAEQEGTD